MINDLRTESRERLASRPRPEIALIEVPSALGRHPSGVQLRAQTSFDEYLSRRANDLSDTLRQHLRQSGGAIEE